MNDEEYYVFEIKMHMHGCKIGYSADADAVTPAVALSQYAFLRVGVDLLCQSYRRLQSFLL